MHLQSNKKGADRVLSLDVQLVTAHETAYKFLTGNHLNAIIWCHKNLPITPAHGIRPYSGRIVGVLADLDRSRADKIKRRLIKHGQTVGLAVGRC